MARRPCAGCDRPARDGWEGHRCVVPVTQYESADLIGDIVAGRLDAVDDPAWHRSGAPTRAAYAAWAGRGCGLACVRAALGHWRRRVPAAFELLDACVPYGVYDAEGGPASPGMRYRPLLAYLAAEHGLDGEVVEAPVRDALAAGVLESGLLMWSVHRSVRYAGRPGAVDPPSVGGHLVLLHAVHWADGTVALVNPSGHDGAARSATLSIEVLERYAAPRGVALRNPIVT